MILVEVKPRDDGKFDIYVSEDGEPYVNSSQGYENVEDAERIVRKKLFPPIQLPTGDGLVWSVLIDDEMTEVPNRYIDGVITLVKANMKPVVLKVTYHDGKTKTEQLR